MRKRALSPDPNEKVPVCTVEEAIKLGADAVSIHINLGAATDSEMLRHLGEVSRQCDEWSMPLVAMIYTRGKKIESEYDVKYVKHAARVGAELGADIVKVNYTGSPETFSEVVEGCPVLVVIAGGEKSDTEEGFLSMVAGALEAGAAGVSIGRNAFQHHAPDLMIRAIANMVHQKHTIEQSLELLKGKG